MTDLTKSANDESLDNRTLIRKVYDFGGRFIDYKMGFGGAVLLGGAVFGINAYETHDYLGATSAALKQGGYTFFFGGLTMKLTEYLATRISNRKKAIATSIIIPSLISISLTYGLHNLKGTPEPVLSTLPAATTIVPGTWWWGNKKRKELELICKEQ